MTARGSLLSWTVVHVAPPGGVPGAVVGLVRLASGPVVVAVGDSADVLVLDAEVDVSEGSPPRFRLARAKA